MSSNSYGVGVLGTGIMGRRMLAALQQHPRLRAVALHDPNRQALQGALDHTPGAHAAGSLQHLVQDPALQLVYIASPPAHHLQAVRAALDAGKACLCEKPLAHDVAEALALQAHVLQTGLPFAVNFPFARSAASLGLSDLLHGGALGAVHEAHISVRFAQWPRPWQMGASSWLAGAAEGGFTREVLSHFIFLALRLFGPAQLLECQLQRPAGQTETALRAVLQHASVTLHIDAAVAGSVADQNRFELRGTRGQAALVDWGRLERDGAEVIARTDGTARTLDAVAQMLDGEAGHGLATVDEALAVVQLIEAMLASADPR